MTKPMRKRFQKPEKEIKNVLNTDKPIVLIGLMGVGKTVVGKELSQYYDLPFYDTDSVIEEQTGKKISDIFEEDGESEFRIIEYKVIKSLLGKGKSIISTGGGAFTKMFARELIQEQAVSVWLQASLDLLVLRTSRNIAKRPLLAESDNVEKTLTDLMKSRNRYYSNANIVVPTFNEPVRFTNARVVKSLEQYLTRKQRKSKHKNANYDNQNTTKPDNKSYHSKPYNSNLNDDKSYNGLSRYEKSEEEESRYSKPKGRRSNYGKPRNQRSSYNKPKRSSSYHGSNPHSGNPHSGSPHSTNPHSGSPHNTNPERNKSNHDNFSRNNSTNHKEVKTSNDRRKPPRHTNTSFRTGHKYSSK